MMFWRLRGFMVLAPCFAGDTVAGMGG